jgi:hypothetical protein
MDNEDPAEIEQCDDQRSDRTSSRGVIGSSRRRHGSLLLHEESHAAGTSEHQEMENRSARLTSRACGAMDTVASGLIDREERTLTLRQAGMTSGFQSVKAGRFIERA